MHPTYCSYADFYTGSYAKTCLPSTQKYSIPLMWLFDIHYKGMGYAKEKEKNIYLCLKALEKVIKKGEIWKIAHIWKGTIKREESCKRSSIQKFRTHAHLDLIVWFVFSIGSGFWLCKIYNASMLPFCFLPRTPQKALLDVGRERGDPVPW